MGKLLSKLHKNENKTDNSLYQIYLLNLQKNILKYYRLNLFKEIAIGFNHSFQMTLEHPASLTTLFKLVNAAITLTLISYSTMPYTK